MKLRKLALVLLAGLVAGSVLGLAAGFARADTVTILFDGGRLELTDEKCTDNGIILTFLTLGAPLEVVDRLKAGRATSDNGKVSVGVCYADLDRGSYIVVDETGGYGAISKPQKI